MGIADIVILILIIIALGVAGYFAFSGKGHGSCCGGGNCKNHSGCDGNCASCHRH